MLEKYHAGRCTLGWLVYKSKTYLQVKKICVAILSLATQMNMHIKFILLSTNFFE